MARRNRSRSAALHLDLTLLALCASLAAGCGRDGPRASDAHDAPGAAASRPALAPYHVTDVRHASAIVGRVTVASDAPRDSVVQVTADQPVCGTTTRVPLVEHRGTRLENAVVWLDDLRHGKPLPVDRRYEVTMYRCAILPRVQAAIAGGMLNVRSADPTVHRTRFVLDGTVLDRVQETDAGQVVPTEKVLAHAGLVEAHCDVHPWAQAWVRVFDQPYFAVTNRDGTFTIDSVPPGTYHLVAWQPRLGRRELEVRVDSARDSKIVIGF